MRVFLENLRESCMQRNIPIISMSTQNFLSKMISKIKPKYCLEIGGAVGYSSIFMGSIISEWEGKIISCELSYPNYKEALYNIKQSGLHNISFYNFNFNKINLTQLVYHKIDFLFIDAMKIQYLDYLCKIKDFLAVGHTIVLDDVIKYSSKMQPLYAFLEKNQVHYEILQLDQDDGIMIIKDMSL